MHQMPVITNNRDTRVVNSVTVLYLAKSGVNTAISSPPFETVMAVIYRNDKPPPITKLFLCFSNLSKF